MNLFLNMILPTSRYCCVSISLLFCWLWRGVLLYIKVRRVNQRVTGLFVDDRFMVKAPINVTFQILVIPEKIDRSNLGER